MQKYGLKLYSLKNMNFISKMSLIDYVAKNTNYNDEKKLKEIERNERF